jgi:hypothetical protein
LKLTDDRVRISSIIQKKQVFEMNKVIIKLAIIFLLINACSTSDSNTIRIEIGQKDRVNVKIDNDNAHTNIRNEDKNVNTVVSKVVRIKHMMSYFKF